MFYLISLTITSFYSVCNKSQRKRISGIFTHKKKITHTEIKFCRNVPWLVHALDTHNLDKRTHFLTCFRHGY